MNMPHESLSDKQTAIRIVSVVGSLLMVLLLVIVVSGLLG